MATPETFALLHHREGGYVGDLLRQVAQELAFGAGDRHRFLPLSDKGLDHATAV